MEVKIGVQHATRELVLDVDSSPEELESMLEKALSDDGGMLALADAKGRRILVPADRVAYVELSTSVTGTVGFRS